MFKRLVILIAVIWALTPCTGTAASEAAMPDKILLICDYTTDSQVAPMVRSISGILTYMSKNFDLALPDALFRLDDYGYIILLIGSDHKLSQVNANILRQTEKPILVIGPNGIDQLSQNLDTHEGYFEIRYPFQGDSQQTYVTDKQRLYFLKEPDTTYAGTVQLITQQASYPLCASRGNLTQIAWYSVDASWMPYAAADLITDWMWPYQNTPHQYGTYLVLDSVYPFEDLALLMQVSDMLHEQSIPYAIMVMPVFDNTTYPSMKRFCEYLRYAQSRGAAIVLRTPLVSIANVETDELKERIQFSYEAYTQYGVYPLALAAPEAYLYLDKGLTLLNGVRTVFLFETDDGWPQSTRNHVYQYGHAVIAPAYTASAGLMPNVYPTAVYLHLHDGMEILSKQVQAYRKSSTPLRSLWDLHNVLYIGPHYFSNSPGNEIYYDAEPVSLMYAPFTYDDNYTYERGFIFYLTDQIDAGNRLILVLVFFFSTLFILMILIARRRMKRQFLIRPSADGETKSKE